MDIKIIRTKEEYGRALKRLSQLMDVNPAPGSKDENTLELLALVIQEYEQKNTKPIVVDPVEAIKFRAEQMEFTRNDLIPFFGSISRVSEVLSRKRHLSLSMIRKLHEGLGIPLESLVHQRPLYRKKKSRALRSRNRKRVS